MKSGETANVVETEKAVMSSTTATAVEEEAAESAEAEGQSKAMSVTVQDIEGDGSLISDRARSMDERLRRLRQWMAKKGGAEPAEPTTTGSTASDTLKSAASTLNAVKGMALDHEDMDIDSSSDDEPIATNQRRIHARGKGSSAREIHAERERNDAEHCVLARGNLSERWSFCAERQVSECRALGDKRAQPQPSCHTLSARTARCRALGWCYVERSDPLLPSSDKST